MKTAHINHPFTFVAFKFTKVYPHRMNPTDRRLLDKHLPRGWHAEAVAHFKGRYSGGLISRVKAGDRENLDILRWLINRAKRHKDAQQRLTTSLRSLKD